ncbi:arginine--tRNA ligase [Coralliovum pocilloporae]|uniref:arginine--tRNA ligase n=1 Tax=Coralliovum pocilloporae TaxID=3066369 RepID=UPI0033077BAA
MNVFALFQEKVCAAVGAAGLKAQDGSALPFDRLVVEPPRDAAHGDMATNAAMVLAKLCGAKPRDLAEQLVAELEKDADIASASVAGPGFINLTLDEGFWRVHLQAILQSGVDYGRAELGQGRKVNVEYVSANPTGPMHVGHTRGAVVGDTIANLLDFAGYKVTREYYTNDAGAQVDVLARSAYLRYREANGEDIGGIPEGLYPGDYLVSVGEALKTEFGDKLMNHTEVEWLPLVRPRAIDAMMAMIKDDLAALNVKHDVFFSERSLVTGSRDRVADAMAYLKGRDLVYEGTLPPPKGQLPDDWEDREQTLFRSTEFGDDIDRPLVKSDGSYTYFGSDVAYHFDKFERGFDYQIDIWGADHGGYVKRMKAAVAAMSEEKASLDVKLCQLVKLFRDGEPLKMSKRAGTFVTLRDVVEEVGVDAVRFMMMYRKPDAPLDFDFKKVTEQTRDNPVFYVQYAHARTASIFRQALDEIPDLDVSQEALSGADLSGLTDEGELGLIRKLAEYPRLIESAALAQEPYRVSFYLYELASALHGQWNRGKELPQLRFINPKDRELTQARLVLVRAVALVISSGLAIIGVSAPDEMR